MCTCGKGIITFYEKTRLAFAECATDEVNLRECECLIASKVIVVSAVRRVDSVRGIESEVKTGLSQELELPDEVIQRVEEVISDGWKSGLVDDVAGDIRGISCRFLIESSVVDDLANEQF